jgi:uncharacterized protein (TIGR03435 family)
VNGTIKAMAWIKTKTAIVIGASTMLVAGATLWQTEYFNTNTMSVLDKMPPQVQILPAKFPQSKGWAFVGNDTRGHGFVGTGKTVKELLYWAYRDWPGDRFIFPETLSSNKYDFIDNLPTGASQALQKEVEKQFGLVGKPVIRETNVLLLRVANSNAKGLKLYKGPPTKYDWRMAKGIFAVNDMAMTNLASFLEMYLLTPVIDRTGLSGRFDFNLKLNMDQFPMDWKEHRIDDFRPALLDQLGLELVPSREPIEMLVVEKVK